MVTLAGANSHSPSMCDQLTPLHRANMRPRFDNSITFGNVLQITIVIGGLIGAWVNIRGSVDRHDTEIASGKSTMAEISRVQTSLTHNLDVLTAIVDERTRRAIP